MGGGAERQRRNAVAAWQERQRRNAVAAWQERQRRNAVEVAGHFHAAGQKGPFLDYHERCSEGQWHYLVISSQRVQTGTEEGGPRQGPADLQVPRHHVDLHSQRGLEGCCRPPPPPPPPPTIGKNMRFTLARWGGV